MLPIEGEVKHPTVFCYEDLLSMPSKSLLVAMECSGNKRARFSQKVYGEQWEDGAISQGVWSGVPLRELLHRAGIKDSAQEVVFEGHDYGYRTDTEEPVPFARSLAAQQALHPDILVAFEYNGRPVPFKHGYPFRLIVPHWYAMASVKWLKKITVIDHPFQGPFQTIDYNYYPNAEHDVGNSIR